MPKKCSNTCAEGAITQPFGTGFELLTPAQMQQADQAAIALGMTGPQLMRNAGAAVARVIARRWMPCRTVIVCGPGNNGGDGYIVATTLQQWGWDVVVAVLHDAPPAYGDAAWAAAMWTGETLDSRQLELQGFELVVDAMFGAGMSRPLQGAAQSMARRINASGLPVCCIDVPSGLDGATGQVKHPEPRSTADAADVIMATLTVSFFRAKPGHLLLPGRQYCAETVIVDIGIPASVLLKNSDAPTWRNVPDVWQSLWPSLKSGDHKYRRGHVLVYGGLEMTGAARLSAMAAQANGAGLVTLAVPPARYDLYAGSVLACMVESLAQARTWQTLLSEKRRNVCVIGPGAGVSEKTRADVLLAVDSSLSLVLDADAISAFQAEPNELLQALSGRRVPTTETVLTPHEAEFGRLFPALGQDQDKLRATREAAVLSRSIVLNKGADTVVAAPDGRVMINAHAPPWLATGGSGDVLAGLIAALMAQGMPAFEAACAAVWCHSEAAQRLGPPMTAETLIAKLPSVLSRFYQEQFGPSAC